MSLVTRLERSNTCERQMNVNHVTNMSCTALFAAAADIALQVMPTWDDNKLVMKYEPKEADSAGKPQTHTRELNGEELVLV